MTLELENKVRFWSKCLRNISQPSCSSAGECWEGAEGRQVGQRRAVRQPAGRGRPQRRPGDSAQDSLHGEGGDGQDLPGERWWSVPDEETAPAVGGEKRFAWRKELQSSPGNNEVERIDLKVFIDSPWWNTRHETRPEAQRLTWPFCPDPALHPHI